MTAIAIAGAGGRRYPTAAIGTSRYAERAASWQHHGVGKGGLDALLVDVGGTLVDDATWLDRPEYERLMVARMRDAFGSDLPWFASLASHGFAEADAAPWEQRTAEAVMSFLTAQGVEVSAAEVERICRACALPLNQVVQVAPGAREGVRAIRDLGVRMVVCTNTVWRNDADVRRDWEELGFGDCFDGYVSSYDAGHGKPHPAIFERALAVVGTDASRAAIIGDRPDRDVAGARAVGMRSILMRPPDVIPPADPPPDAEVSRWPEVPRIIEGWLQSS